MNKPRSDAQREQLMRELLTLPPYQTGIRIEEAIKCEHVVHGWYMPPLADAPADCVYTGPIAMAVARWREALGIPEQPSGSADLPSRLPLTNETTGDLALSNQGAEAVAHPAHYGGASNPYEAIKVIEAWSEHFPEGTGFHLGNTVKYISRSGRKDSAKTIEDLKKARWYLDRAISLLEERCRQKSTGKAAGTAS